MTNAELKPKESRIDRLNEHSQNMSKKSTQIAKFKAFCEMDHETLDKHLLDSVPVPPKDQPFADEVTKAETNPFLVEMMESTRCLSFVEVTIRSRNLLLSLLVALAVWLLGGHVWAWILLGIVVVVDQGWLIGLRMQALRIKFMSNYAHFQRVASRPHDPVIGHQNYWNLQRMKKWAVARYEIASEDAFMKMMGKEGEMVKYGPMAGRFVSTSTGEEWPLRQNEEDKL